MCEAGREDRIVQKLECAIAAGGVALAEKAREAEPVIVPRPWQYVLGTSDTPFRFISYTEAQCESAISLALAELLLQAKDEFRQMVRETAS